MDSIKPAPTPNFFVIGAPKAGTSALYFCLKQHPDIFMSAIKEPHYFTFEKQAPIFAGPKGDHFHLAGIFRPLDYLSLFIDATTQTAIGESSTTYLNSKFAAQRIYKFAPKAKIVALLRHPVDRAYSHYNYLKSQGVELSPDFVDALSRERKRKEMGWFPGHLYKEGGYYFSQLNRYYNLFKKDQIKVYLYEDWNHSPLALMCDLFRFLGVDDTFIPQIYRNNVTLIPHNHRINQLVKRQERLEQLLPPFVPLSLKKNILAGLQLLNKTINLYPPPPIAPEIRRELILEYHDDIIKLQNLIGRDLTHWLSPPT